jgi:predicted PurR-regulated permease PerM
VLCNYVFIIFLIFENLSMNILKSNNIMYNSFTNSKPNLINIKAYENINKIFNIEKEIQTTTGQHLYNIFNDYIRPNSFAIISLLLVCVVLFIKYYMKKNNIKDDIIIIPEEIKNKVDKVESVIENIKETFKDVNENNENKNDDDDINDIFNDKTEEDDDITLDDKEDEKHMSNNAKKEYYENQKTKNDFDKLSKLIVDGDDD